MSLSPTISSIQDLFAKAERELNRAYHAESEIDIGDHFYNMCITVNAMRDYYLELKNIAHCEEEKKKYYKIWSSVKEIKAIQDISNTVKHFQLRTRGEKYKSKIKDVGFKDIEVYRFYKNHDQEMLVKKGISKTIKVIFPDGEECELWSFASSSLDYWINFLQENGVPMRRQ